MTKPHEEEWVVHPQDYRAVCHLNAADPSESLVIADLRADEPREVAEFIAAAPKMARAMLQQLGTGPRKHLSICHALTREGAPCHEDCAAVRDALRAAGVLE